MAEMQAGTGMDGGVLVLDGELRAFTASGTPDFCKKAGPIQLWMVLFWIGSSRGDSSQRVCYK